MDDEVTGRFGERPDDETRPIDLDPPFRGLKTDPEPAVAAALAVIQRSLKEMATSATKPLLDPPQQSFRLRPLGRTDLMLHPVVLDASRLGSVPDRVTAHRVLDAYAAAGGNTLLLDDAADGSAAQLVGTWLLNRRRRDQVVLGARIGASGDLSAAGVQTAVERMLNRLGTDRLDLLVLATHVRGTSFEETLTAASGLVDSGRIGTLVAGDHSAERLMQARVAAGQRGLERFEAVAPTYSLLRRDGFEGGTSSVVHAQQLGLLPRSPLAGGFLANAIPTRGALRRMRELHPERAERLQPLLTRRGIRIVDALVRIAHDREVGPGTVAIAWLLTRPHVTAPVVAARSVEQVWTATAAAGLHLTRAEAGTLDRAAES